MIAEQFQETYGVPAAVVNTPGGGGGPFPGAAEVGIPALHPNPFEPVGIFLTYPFVIATAGDAPYSTMDELASYAAENDVALGHFGSVLIPTQVTLALAETMGFDY